MRRNWSPHTLLVVPYAAAAILESSVIVPQAVKQSPHDPTTLLGYIRKRSENICSHEDLDTSGHIAVLLVIAKKWKQLKRPSITEWINKTWCNHTREYYSAIKRNEVLIYAAHNNMNEPQKHFAKSQNPVTKYHVIIQFHLYEMSRIGKSVEAESRLVAVLG